MTGPFEPHLSFLTLAVADVRRATRFYEALGLTVHPRSGTDYTFFQLNGLVLALYGAADLEALWGEGTTGDRPRTALSHNVSEPDRIDAILACVRSAGGQIRVPRGPTPWGGECAWFEDPDGHCWEVVYNPRLARDDHGGAWLSPRSAS